MCIKVMKENKESKQVYGNEGVVCVVYASNQCNSSITPITGFVIHINQFTNENYSAIFINVFLVMFLCKVALFFY